MNYLEYEYKHMSSESLVKISELFLMLFPKQICFLQLAQNPAVSYSFPDRINKLCIYLIQT